MLIQARKQHLHTNPFTYIHTSTIRLFTVYKIIISNYAALYYSFSILQSSLTKNCLVINKNHNNFLGYYMNPYNSNKTNMMQLCLHMSRKTKWNKIIFHEIAGASQKMETMKFYMVIKKQNKLTSMEETADNI